MKSESERETEIVRVIEEKKRKERGEDLRGGEKVKEIERERKGNRERGLRDENKNYSKAPEVYFEREIIGKLGTSHGFLLSFLYCESFTLCGFFLFYLFSQTEKIGTTKLINFKNGALTMEENN